MSQLTYASDAGTSRAASSSSPQPPSHSPTPPRPPSAPPSNKDSALSTGSVEEQLERLTTAVHETGHLIHVCTVLCEERCALALARDEQQQKRAEGVQEQLARMLALTQETLRREREVRVTGALSFAWVVWGAGVNLCLQRTRRSMFWTCGERRSARGALRTRYRGRP